MRVLIVGSNGHTGRLLVEQLAAHDSHEPVAMVRREGQAERLRERGASTVLLADLEGERPGAGPPDTSALEAAVAGVDAVMFAAGSGSATDVDKTIHVDLMGAIRLIETCRHHGPDRFVMLSAQRTDRPGEGPEVLRPYLAAKAEADWWLMNGPLAYTILRPGRLTHDPGTGRIDAARDLGRYGEIARADVAAAMVTALDEPATEGATIEILSGSTPIRDALLAAADV